MSVLSILALLSSLSFQDSVPPVLSFHVRSELPVPGSETGTLWASFELAAGWTTVPNPLLPPSSARAMLQIAVPPGVRLLGDHAESLPELLRSVFLDLPYERLLSPEPTSIEFRILDGLAEEAAFEFNVLAYVTSKSGDSALPRFLRKRYRLSLKPDAVPVEVSAATSTWGPGTALQLGEESPTFELPSADGTLRSLEEFLGAGPVVLATYRSCL